MSRIKFLKIVLGAALGLIIVQLFVIQIVQHDEWTAKATDQQTLLETIVAERGKIYMMDDGEPVAVVLNQAVYTVIIDPQITDKEELKKVLDEHAKQYVTADIDKVYEIEGLRYSIVAKNVPREVVQKLRESDVALWFQENVRRVYPEGELASSLLGFMNVDGIGQYGVEGALNARLAGTNGLLKTISDVNDVALSIGDDNVRIPAVDGENIVLSIDRGLQRDVEDALVSAVENTAATNAAAIVMDPVTGEVLAMANVPTYNPAKYDQVSDWTAYLNYTTEVPYEPGSICKTFSFAAAMNDGAMTPDSTYFNEGYIVIDGARINNATLTSNVYGNISMRTVLTYSLNTGSIQALKWLGGDSNNINEAGRQKLYDYYDNFGFGKVTGIEIAEAEGLIHGPNEGYAPDLTYANMTFGQGMNTTMIQVATAFSAMVNGGYMITPTVVKGTIVNGELVPEQIAKEEIRQVISEDVSADLRVMLHDTRSIYYKQDNPGYYLGGKTGTSQVYLEETGAYSEADGETIATYIGFGGIEGELPKYVIVVKMWGEGQHMNGATDAKTLFDDVSDVTIDNLKIKPKGY